MNAAALEEMAARVEAELREVLALRSMPLYDMMAYHMGWGDAADAAAGPSYRRRARGVLCLLSCRAAGGGEDAALPIAASVELVHNFCQIHDDVQSGNPRRDGRDSLWWVWGPAQAINAGDGMHALARLSVFRMPERGSRAELATRVIRMLDQASLDLCEGRFLDLESQERPGGSVDAYMSMARLKGGSLVSCAMALGGVAASGDDAVVRGLGECGALVGTAAQIAGDMAEVWGDAPGQAGAGTELMNKKKLLPVAYAFERAGVGARRRLGELYMRRVLEPGDVATLRALLDEFGAREYCLSVVNDLLAQAGAALRDAGIQSAAASDIEDLAATMAAAGPSPA